jgi:bacteriocin-like protein
MSDAKDPKADNPVLGVPEPVAELSDEELANVDGGGSVYGQPVTFTATGRNDPPPPITISGTFINSKP